MGLLASRNGDEMVETYLVSHRRLFSDLIQSSSRPRKTYKPGDASWNKSPVWKSPSTCLRDTSGQSGDSEGMTSSRRRAVDWCPESEAAGEVGMKRYEYPSNDRRRRASRPDPPTENNMAESSVLPYKFCITPLR